MATDLVTKTPLDLILEEVDTEDRASLRDAVKAALARFDPADLESKSYEELAAMDATVPARVIYLLSLWRVAHYLKMNMGAVDDAEKQARLAMGYIRHAEKDDKDPLRTGRGTAGEKQLVEAAASMQRELDEVANFKAQAMVKEIMAKKEKNGKAPETKRLPT